MDRNASLFTPVLIVGCVIILVSFAVRASFGVFQIPIADEFGWLRSEFSLAIAFQNLAWGIGQPIFGAIAARAAVTRSSRWVRCFTSRANTVAAAGAPPITEANDPSTAAFSIDSLSALEKTTNVPPW